jgi:SpoVK/Ycf46/Vps4 family AAA+-type ATPase
MIMLLSGEPGTGKTLTSESISEAMRKPLYSMSAGELGLTAAEVEQNLSRVLELSKKWSSVLLLDECDVFLERRSSSDLHRNKLVSVFLRLLEYYQGVMFLTTNRASSFDPAFESRIDLTLHYPNLDVASRLSVWRTFVQPESDKTSIQESDLATLAEESLNGRQIKNVVKTSRLLASRDKVPLQLNHIETVLRVKRGERAYQLQYRI